MIGCQGSSSNQSTTPGLYGAASRALGGHFRSTSLRWSGRVFQKFRSASFFLSTSSYGLSTNFPWGFLDSCSTYLDSFMLDEISRDNLVIMIIMISGRKQRASRNGQFMGGIGFGFYVRLWSEFRGGSQSRRLCSFLILFSVFQNPKK